MRSDVSEITGAAQCLRETCTAIKFDSIEPGIVKVHAHEYRSCRRCGYKHEPGRVLCDDLVAAEKGAGCTRRKRERQIEIDLTEFRGEAG